MRRRVADPNDAGAGLCDGVIVFDRAAAHADGSDQNAFLVDNGGAAGKSDQAALECSIPNREPPGGDSLPIWPW